MKTVYYLLLGLCIAMAACKPEEPELPKEPNQSIDEDINDTYNNILTWTYDTINATLTISGSGSMKDFHSSYDPAPWYAYKKDIRTVIIGDSVTYIGKYAFYDCDGLATITIPNSVTSIGGYAFADCDGLKQVTLPDKLESIEENTFYNCDLLTEINIPASVTSIGIEAFKYCYNLTKFTIGNGVTSIGKSAFDGCYMLTAVYYTGDVAGWCSITFESYDSNPLYYAQNLYIGNTLVTELAIPEGVSEIKNYAFYGCSATQVSIPDGVTSIGNYAFDYCEALTQVTIGNGVESIGDRAFRHCSALTQVTIGNSVTSIGDRAFDNCSKLTAVYYTGDVAGWCGITFDDYDSNPLYYAQNLYIGNTLVTELAIPEGVSEIKNYAFIGCDALTQITIPNSVTSIGNMAFIGCTALTQVNIPDGVESIGEYAFYNCSALAEMTVLATVPPTIGGAYTFYNVSRDIPVYVPAESLEAYKAAEVWKEFTNLQAIP